MRDTIKSSAQPPRSFHPYFNALGLLVFSSILAMILAQALSQQLEALLYIGRWVPLGLLMVYAVGRWASSPHLSVPSIRRWQGFDAWIVGWIGLAYISFIYSIDPGATVVMATTFLLGYGAVFWGVWHYADRYGEERVIKMLLWSATLILIASWVSLATGYGRPFMGSVLREFSAVQSLGVLELGGFRGILENPNALGQLSALILPLFLERSLKSKSIYVYLLLGLTVVTLLYTFNRSGIGAASVASSYILWKAKNVDRGIAILFLAMTVGLGLYSFRGQIANTILQTDVLTTTSNRDIMWGLFADYIQNRPLLGHGWGTEGLLHEHYGTNIEKFLLRQSVAGSSYIGFAAQVGLIGASVYFVPLLWLSGRTAFVSQNAPLRVHTLNAVLIIGITTAASESWMSSMGHAKSLLFWIPVMLLIRRRALAREAYTKSRRTQGMSISGT